MIGRAALILAAIGLAACDGGAPKPAPSARASASAAPEAMNAELSFARDGKPIGAITRAELEAAAPPETWTAFDPYYNKPKTYRALPLAAVLEKGFGAPASELARHDFLLRARDGYTVPLPGSKLLERGGYLAVADVEVPGWEPIGQGRANPGPFYLVWRDPAQHSLDTHPRPWQLASIEIAPFEATFPHLAPRGAADGSPARRGFGIFRERCVACHAINREGGRVGPDLNVPQSIVEYRPEPQIRAYIKDPRTYRYSNMPAHPGLSDTDLDALMAYFHAMKAQKHDAEADKAGGH